MTFDDLDLDCINCLSRGVSHHTEVLQQFVFVWSIKQNNVKESNLWCVSKLSFAKFLLKISTGMPEASILLTFDLALDCWTQTEAKKKCI